ncbi:hypothetical protein [Paraflavitalea speifideaquila]|uniref:hypothetical protein n=1 Tax=Paraflavitalea speifideaquila TaxID=3076558 RepID=UPI0028EE1125|nr:hypothetical protein [Paraflavitalea speifideiaquila]
MHHAGVLARASEWVTPVYNNLTEDWRCHDLYRKLVGLGVKLLHQGATKETVQQAAWEELTRLGYRTDWPQWELPPALAKWMEEERREDRKSGSREVRSRKAAGSGYKKPVQGWVVNEKGQLVFAGATYNANPLSTYTYSIAAGVSCQEEEVAMPPPVEGYLHFKINHP